MFRCFAFVCIAFSLVLSPTAHAQLDAKKSDVGSQIRSILNAAYSNDSPGAAVIAVRGGETVFNGARGMANLELGVPLKPDSVFRLGSITKQFTAAATMMLVDEGKLSLDDDITKFLPDYPTHGNKITVEHLLTHTSGIKSYTNIPGWMQTRIVKPMTVDELIDGFKDEPMEFKPDEKYNYNNSGYVLLGAIIEKVSGKTYEEFVQERIFDSLGMQHSYYGSHKRIIPDRASGYAGSAQQPANAPYLSMSQPYAAGSLLATVGDLARWNEALFSGKVVSEESLKKMVTAYTLPNGTSTGYGYGLAPSDIRGHRSIQHGGGIFGFNTYGIYLPDDDVYVAVLCNASPPKTSPSRVATEIAALVAGDPFPKFKTVDVPEEILREYVGVYRIDDNTTRVVTVSDGKLYTQRSGSQRLEAFPSSETAFFYKTSFSHLEFVKDDSGKITEMKMFPNGSRQPEVAKRTDEKPMEREVADVDPEIFNDYVGTFELQPGFNIVVTREGDQLMAQATGQPKFEIFPASETVYFLKVVNAELTFVRGDDGKVNEATLKQAGREMTAKRIK